MMDEISKKNNEFKAEEKTQIGNKENFQDNGNVSNVSNETSEVLIPENNLARKRKKPQGGMQSTSSSSTVVAVPVNRSAAVPQEKPAAASSFGLGRSCLVQESDLKNLPFPQKVAVYAQDIHVYLRSMEVYI